MKKLNLLIMVLLPLLTLGQAHFGMSETEIKESYPQNTFEKDYTNPRKQSKEIKIDFIKIRIIK